MTSFNKSLTASQSFNGSLSLYSWYIGTLRETSIGVLRAMSRAIKGFITKNPDLI